MVPEPSPRASEPRTISQPTDRPAITEAPPGPPSGPGGLDTVAILVPQNPASGLNGSEEASAPHPVDSRAGEAETESTPPGGPARTSSEAETSEDLAPSPAQPDEDTEEASLAIPRGAMPAPLRGSLASLERQNTRLETEGLERIEDEDDLSARIADHLLVPVPVSPALTINENLALNHRYCRPWTARFLTDLARAHQAAFHRPLEVSSAVRTVEYQKQLLHVNGNAAPAEGDIVSPHLTGAAVDIAKDGLSRDEVGWMRKRLLGLENQGKIDVEEEFRQSCFHITVYKSYDPPRRSRTPARTRDRQKQPDPPPAPDSSTGGSAEGQ